MKDFFRARELVISREEQDFPPLRCSVCNKEFVTIGNIDFIGDNVVCTECSPDYEKQSKLPRRNIPAILNISMTL